MKRRLRPTFKARRPIHFGQIVLLVILLSACGGSDNHPDPTATTAPPTATAVVPSPAATVAASPATSPSPSRTSAGAAGQPRPAATFPPGLAQTITDGICQAQIPTNWVDNGTGRGSTASGARYVLFGGRIPNDAAWQQAVALVKQYAETQPGATVEEGDGFIRVMLANNGGFEYRARFDATYCDFSVTSPRGAVPKSEQRDWTKIAASLEPVE
jgi:hypothetical protein